jgi:hypothetical protein
MTAQYLYENASDDINNRINDEQLYVMLSEGEIIDRYTILDIKNKEIIDDKRKKEVVNEIFYYKRFDKLKDNFIILYKLLYYVNKQIWDFQNIMSNFNQENSKLAHDIFEYNQYRFRLKNIINISADSKFKEQKSYNLNEITLNLKDSDNIFTFIIYSILKYDTVKVYFGDNIDKHIISTVKLLFPSINYIEKEGNNSIKIDINDYEFITIRLYIENELSNILNKIIINNGNN